jgi:predicted negative regulator of RcsB-dependent stress response
MTKTGAATTRPAFDDHAESVTDWARTNSKPLGIALGVVALAAVLWVVGTQWRNQRAGAADAALSRARQSYAQGNLPLAQTDLRRVITRFGGSSAGSQATMLLAQAYYEQGKADSGLRVLNEGKPSSADRASFEALKGAGYEQQKKWAEAAERYQAAAGLAETKVAKDRYLADAARSFTEGGKMAEAEKIWLGLSKDNTSVYSAEARLRVGELTATPAAK